MISFRTAVDNFLNWKKSIKNKHEVTKAYKKVVLLSYIDQIQKDSYYGSVEENTTFLLI